MERNKWTGWLRCIVLTTCLVLSACAPEDQHVFKLGANNWLGYQPFFTAQNKQFWDVESISLVELGSSTEVIRALSNQSIDAAALTLDEAISARARNGELQIVMVVDFSHGGDVLIARPEISTLADLKGKTIALENTALGAVMLDAVLEHSELSEGDIRILPLTFAEHAGALENEEVDAVITFEPVRSRLLAEGYRDLFNSRAIPDTIVDVLVVPESTARLYPERLRAIVSGYFSARDLIVSGDPATIAEVGKRIQLGASAVLEGYKQLHMPDLEENKALLAQCEQGLKRTAEKLFMIMQERRILNQTVNLDNLCNPLTIHEITL